MNDRYDTLVLGGGLAGLTAATLLARAGQRVGLLEASRSLGGRARTRRLGGLAFNLGPHALYRRGAALRTFETLELDIRGATPSTRGLAWLGSAEHTLPVDLIGMLTTGLLRPRGKLNLARLFTRLDGLQPEPLAGRTVRAWVDNAVSDPVVRQLLYALVRLSTYAHAPDTLDAGAAVAQLRLALGGVLYLHGGWAQLVDGLADAAEGAGADLRLTSAARAVHPDKGGWAVSTPQEVLHSQAMVLALAPREVIKLLPSLAEVMRPSVAARAACLEVGLRRCPCPTRTFGLGIDTAVYVSVHSSVAELGEGEVIHVARYLAPGEAPPPRAELEQVLERLQPGFRDEVVVSEYHPRMAVSHGLPSATELGRRPTTETPLSGVYLAGDWVGKEGLLADAAVASAARAAQQISEKGRRRAA